MSRRSTISDLYAATVSSEKLAMANAASPATDKPADRVLAGPVRSMGLALDRLEHESRALKEALATGATVIELDTGLIDPSFVRDRLSEAPADFEHFKQSIADNGQEVPILVRPHPDVPGRFQIAFGHRRWRACADLGRKVKAVVREMSDPALILAQGVENAERKDLSYVERALFAFRLENKGFDRVTICAVLATDKGELSKLITVARSVPEAIIEAIGPAPKAGRRRWLALADALAEPKAKRAVEVLLTEDAFRNALSDVRFLRVLAAATGPVTKQPSSAPIWTSSAGHASAMLSRGTNTTNLVFDKHTEPEFAEFVATRLDDLYEAFQAQAKSRD